MLRTIGQQRLYTNVKYLSLIDTQKVILRHSHIELGLINDSAKATAKESDRFKNLEIVFPQLSDAELKEGVFIDP